MKQRTLRTNFDVRRFTLVELITVVTIAAIMMALFLPLFDNVASGGRVKSAAKMVASHLSLARQYAQGSGRYVALMIPANEVDLLGDYRYSALRLAYVNYDGIDYTFDSWVEDSKWGFTPKSVSIMEADGDLGIVNSSPTPAYVKNPVDDDITTVNIQQQYIGMPLLDASSLTAAQKTTVVAMRAVIFAPSGKPRPVSQTRYVTVGEAQFMGSFWVIKNPGADGTKYNCTANQYTVEINGFTGGTTYRTPDGYPDIAE